MADSRDGSELKRFFAEIEPYIQQPYGVMLVPEFEAHTVGFDRSMPDRLLCGRAVFDAMRSRGILVKAVPRGFSQLRMGSA